MQHNTDAAQHRCSTTPMQHNTDAAQHRCNASAMQFVGWFSRRVRSHSKGMLTGAVTGNDRLRKRQPDNTRDPLFAGGCFYNCGKQPRGNWMSRLFAIGFTSSRRRVSSGNIPALVKASLNI